MHIKYLESVERNFMQMSYTVLENGLDFILHSVINLQILNDSKLDIDDQKKILKYALLHFSSGLELVLKCRLLEENWTYIFANMNTAKKELLESGVFISADSNTVLDRLESLCNITLSQEDKNKLTMIRNYRNQIEHFKINEPLLSIQANIHKGISILISIINEHFVISKFNDEERHLFDQIIEGLKKIQKHYNDVKSIVLTQLENEELQDKTLICPACKENLLLIDEGATCRLCGYEIGSSEEAAEDYLWRILGIDSLTTTLNGGEYPLYECPECGVEALIYDNNLQQYICFHCGIRKNKQEVDFCQKCNKLLFNLECICNDCLDILHYE
jgi:hypothetical protein